jgi:uncharacterized protein (DUF983 family)
VVGNAPSARTISIVESVVSSLGPKLGRALRLRCPRCGAPGMWPSWLKMAPRCTTCGLVFDRGEADHWLGAFAVNWVAGEGVAAVVAIVVLAIWWPNAIPGMAVGIALALLMPLLFFPFSRTIWLAFDLHFRPVEPGDSARDGRAT